MQVQSLNEKDDFVAFVTVWLSRKQDLFRVGQLSDQQARHMYAYASEIYGAQRLYPGVPDVTSVPRATAMH